MTIYSSSFIFDSIPDAFNRCPAVVCPISVGVFLAKHINNSICLQQDSLYFYALHRLIIGYVLGLVFIPITGKAINLSYDSIWPLYVGLRYFNRSNFSSLCRS